LRNVGREGFRHIFVLESPEYVEAVTIERVPLWNDKRAEHGPFDIIGDVHGRADELEELLALLGYSRMQDEGGRMKDRLTHPSSLSLPPSSLRLNRSRMTSLMPTM